MSASCSRVRKNDQDLQPAVLLKLVKIAGDRSVWASLQMLLTPTDHILYVNESVNGCLTIYTHLLVKAGPSFAFRPSLNLNEILSIRFWKHSLTICVRIDLLASELLQISGFWLLPQNSVFSISP